eukprot:g15129.t1
MRSFIDLIGLQAAPFNQCPDLLWWIRTMAHGCCSKNPERHIAAFVLMSQHATFSNLTGEETRLFVTKIPPDITQEDVAKHFAQFGITTDVYLPGYPGRPGHKGMAFVSFADASAAQVAIRQEQSHIINGHEVVVDVAIPKPGEADRLFVTRIPPTLNREHLEKHFAQFGELKDCYMPAAPGSATHKGFAFVSYTNPTSIQVALHIQYHEINGIPVVVDMATPRTGGKGAAAQVGLPPRQAAAGLHMTNGDSASSSPIVPGRLFLTRVPAEVTKADLEAYFGQFGELEDVYIHGNRKGIAFVHLKDPMVSQQILLNKEHFIKPGMSVLVDQALARPSGGSGTRNIDPNSK